MDSPVYYTGILQLGTGIFILLNLPPNRNYGIKYLSQSRAQKLEAHKNFEDLVT